MGCNPKLNCIISVGTALKLTLTVNDPLRPIQLKVKAKAKFSLLFKIFL